MSGWGTTGAARGHGEARPLIEPHRRRVFLEHRQAQLGEPARHGLFAGQTQEPPAEPEAPVVRIDRDDVDVVALPAAGSSSASKGAKIS